MSTVGEEINFNFIYIRDNLINYFQEEKLALPLAKQVLTDFLCLSRLEVRIIFLEK